jgi:uncharacterized membrane protein
MTPGSFPAPPNGYIVNPIRFPRQAPHTPWPVRNVNELDQEQITFGQRASDVIAATVGSWKFIIIQSTLLTIWAALNATAWVRHWDPYPFILMNLVLSLQAAYTAPMIMMSQNRQAVRDRLEAHSDYLVNQRAEEEIRQILDHLTAQDLALQTILSHIDAFGPTSPAGPAAEPAPLPPSPPR